MKLGPFLSSGIATNKTIIIQLEHSQNQNKIRVSIRQGSLRDMYALPGVWDHIEGTGSYITECGGIWLVVVRTAIKRLFVKHKMSNVKTK